MHSDAFDEPTERPLIVISPSDRRQRLADFIEANREPIVDEWEDFARSLMPMNSDTTPLSLRDHVHDILDFIVGYIPSFQSPLEAMRKSRNTDATLSTSTGAETHAALRLASGFNIDQVVAEYRALRGSIVRLWSAAAEDMSPADMVDLTRFNEAVDQEIAESVSHYTGRVGHSNTLLMGILGHDLRNPLNAISMSADLLMMTGSLDVRQMLLATQIAQSTLRVVAIVDDLLDVTRSRLGAALPIMRESMDLGSLIRQIVAEMKSVYPTRDIRLNLSGNLAGDWDEARLGQGLSNLIANAVQYGFADTAIVVAAAGRADGVTLSVHNEGTPISAETISTIFDSLTRLERKGERGMNVNLGLGLYIARDVFTAHQGTLNVTSTIDGTTFTARLPKAVG